MSASTSTEGQIDHGSGPITLDEWETSFRNADAMPNSQLLILNRAWSPQLKEYKLWQTDLTRADMVYCRRSDCLEAWRQSRVLRPLEDGLSALVWPVKGAGLSSNDASADQSQLPPTQEKEQTHGEDLDALATNSWTLALSEKITDLDPQLDLELPRTLEDLFWRLTMAVSRPCVLWRSYDSERPINIEAYLALRGCAIPSLLRASRSRNVVITAACGNPSTWYPETLFRIAGEGNDLTIAAYEALAEIHARGWTLGRSIRPEAIFVSVADVEREDEKNLHRDWPGLPVPPGRQVTVCFVDLTRAQPPANDTPIRQSKDRQYLAEALCEIPSSPLEAD